MVFGTSTDAVPDGREREDPVTYEWSAARE